MLLSKRMQRLGDQAADTLVVRTEHVAAPNEIEIPPDVEPLSLSREQLQRFGDRELRLVRSALRRLRDTSAADPALAAEVARALASRLELDDAALHDAALDPRRFLQRALLTAQRRNSPL
jgi:hypothetical protein